MRTSSIATSLFMNGVVRGVVAMRTRGRSPSRKPGIWYRTRFADNAYALFRRRSPFPLAARATIPVLRPRRTRTLRRLATRGHPTRPRITAAGREYAALAFDVDVVKVGRGWGDEVKALDA